MRALYSSLVLAVGLFLSLPTHGSETAEPAQEPSAEAVADLRRRLAVAGATGSAGVLQILQGTERLELPIPPEPGEWPLRVRSLP